MCISTYAILCFIFSLHRCFHIAGKSTSIICSCAVVPTAVAWCWIVCCAPRIAGIKLESVIVHIRLKTEHPRLPHSQVSICIIIALSYFQSQVSQGYFGPPSAGVRLQKQLSTRKQYRNSHRNHTFAKFGIKFMAIAISPSF